MSPCPVLLVFLMTMANDMLTFSTFNCRGLGQNSKWRAVFQWLRKYYKGIIFLQETHSTKSIEKSWHQEWKGFVEFSHGLSTARGVAIMIDKDIDCIIHEVHRDDMGRFLIVDCSVYGEKIILINVYAPTKDNKDQSKFLTFVHNKLKDYENNNIILGGDFNVCLDPTIDKKGGKIEKPSKCAEIINSISETYNLIDLWRYLNPESRRFTRREMTKAGLVQSRLDYFLISVHLLYDFTRQDIAPSIKSDHSLVYFQLRIKSSEKPGRGFFKFNCSHLKDVEYITKVKEIVKSYRNNLTSDDGLNWDTLKCEIRGYTISYSTEKKKKLRKYESELLERLAYIERNLNDGNKDEYDTLKSQLEQIYNENAIGIKLRSRARFFEESEQNIAFFKKEE